jgi:hypothetical protein
MPTVLTLRRVLALLLLCSAAVACGTGGALQAVQLTPPSLQNVPAATNQATLQVSGRRPPNTEVWALFDSGLQLQLSTAAADPTFTGTLTLKEGRNTFALVAKNSLGATESTGSYTVLLKTNPPDVPTLNYAATADLSAAPTAQTVLSGLKSPGSAVLVTTPGGLVQVPADGATSWSLTVSVGLGSNAFSVVSVDEVGNRSGTTSWVIYGSSIVPPRIDATSYRTPTNRAAQTLSGTKAVGTALFASIGGATPVSVGRLGSPTWSYTFSLPSQGPNVFAIYATDPSAPSAPHSASATATLVLKTSLPAPPILSTPLPNPLPETNAATLALSGSLPLDGYLCVSAAQYGPCLVTNANMALGGSFSVQVPLCTAAQRGDSTNAVCYLPGATGLNPLYISAVDLAGNYSPAIISSVYRDAAPVLSNVLPVSGQVLLDPNGLHTIPVISVTAAPNPSDADATLHPGAQIARINVCVDNATCPPAQAGGSFMLGQVPLVNFANGSQHSIRITVTTVSGVGYPFTIGFVYSTGAPILISDDQSPIEHPAVGAKAVYDAQNNLHVVWQDYCNQTTCSIPTGQSLPPDIFYRRRDASGAWSPISVISSTGADDGQSLSPSLAVDSAGQVHITWADQGSTGGKPTGFGILHRVLRPVAGGGPSGSFALDANIKVVGAPTAGIDDVNPSLAADASGNVHVSFTHEVNTSITTGRYDILYARYTAAAWSAPLQLTSDPNTGRADLSHVDAGNGTPGAATVVWQECRMQGNPGGQNFCTSAPFIAGDSANYDIYLRQVQSPAAADPTTVLVTTQPKSNGFDGDSRRPTVFVDPTNTTWIFWDDTSRLQNQTHRNIWLRNYVGNAPQPASQSTNSYLLVSLDPAALLSEAPAAVLGSDGATVAVAWDATIATGPPLQTTLYGAYGSVSLGLSGQNIQIYGAAKKATTPSLALDPNGDWHTVWQDSSTYGAANAAQMLQIFYQYLPRPQ